MLAIALASESWVHRPDTGRTTTATGKPRERSRNTVRPGAGRP